MSDDSLAERLAAVERSVSAVDGVDPSYDYDALDDRVDSLAADVAELEAAVQAVRGYVGDVKRVNDEVEARADAAMAKAQSLERAFEAGDGCSPPEPARTESTSGCPRCGASGPEARGGGAATERASDGSAVDDGRLGETPHHVPTAGAGVAGHRRVGEAGDAVYPGTGGSSGMNGTRSGGEEDGGGLVARLREVL